jgi:site-specific DNA recombinase
MRSTPTEQRANLQHTVERLIDSFAEGLIEKDQFASRMARTKGRIAELDARIKADSGAVDQREHIRLATNRLRELAATIGTELASADWLRRREIIRTLVQRIDIDTEVIKIIFRVTQNSRGSSSDAIAITLSRPSKRFSAYDRSSRTWNP